MPNGNLLTIGEVAAQTGLRPSAIRYYESAGLLPSPARSNGQRRYDAGIIQQIGSIQTAQKAGFSIEEMKNLLANTANFQPYAERVQSLARRKLAELDTIIEHAKAMSHLLEVGLSCQCDQAADCTLFAAGAKESAGDCRA